MYAMDGAGVGDADQRLKPKQKIKHLNVKHPMQVSPLPSRLPSPVGRPQPTELRVHRRGGMLLCSYNTMISEKNYNYKFSEIALHSQYSIIMYSLS